MFDVFLYPLVLLLLLPTWLFVWWLIRKQDSAYVWKKHIDEKFLPHLLEQKKATLFKTPFWLGVVLSLMVVALAGPSWKSKELTQSNEISEVVWVLHVSESMQSKDLMPSRFKRALFKVEDFLSQHLQMRSALVAYNGSAHLVMPLTKDKDIIHLFASSLSPEIMPVKGDALYDALKLASKQFMEVDGSIVVLTDSISKEQKELVEDDGELEKFNIIYYNISSDALRHSSMEDALQISFDDSDIKELDSSIKRQFEASAGMRNAVRENGGYYLLPLIVLLMLFWFKRGFLGELWRVR
jgi:Ca-activated chloride channel family protein